MRKCGRAAELEVKPERADELKESVSAKRLRLRADICQNRYAQGHGEDMTRAHPHPLEKILDSRIAIIDGAMGTTIRTYGMTESDIRGERFKNSTKGLLNNGDLF